MATANDAPGDEELLARMVEGDHEALREVHRRHGRSLYLAAYSWLRSAPDAEDVTQEAFLLLWKKKQAIRLYTDSLFPWLYTAARLVARNHQRKVNRRRANEIPYGHADPESLSVGLRKADLSEVVVEAMSHLSEVDRSIVGLVLLHGYSYAEAAARLGLSHAVIRNRLSRARKSLRSEISLQRRS